MGGEEFEFGEINELKIIFDKDKKIKLSDLSAYLYNLKVVYTSLYKNPKSVDKFAPWDYNKISQKRANVVQTLFDFSISYDINWTFQARNSFFNSNLKNNDLYIEKIEKSSPLAITVEGILLLLTVAIVISGGKIKYNPETGSFEAEMPPIAEGLKKLKELYKS